MARAADGKRAMGRLHAAVLRRAARLAGRRAAAPWLLAPALVATGAVSPTLRQAGAAPAWLQASARTEGAPGQQLSYFRAFTTLDQAGTLEVPVPRICVRAVGHEVQERCAENVSSVELVERVQGLVGIGDRCVETLASANTSEGALTATARACP